MLTPWPSVRRALIQLLRANFVLAAALPGDWSEGFAPKTTSYPLGVLALAYGPAVYDWSGVVHVLGVDVFVYAEDSGDAASIDQFVFDTLQDARLPLTGLTSLSCRRTLATSLQDVDEQGKPIYQVGGTYEIRVAQSNAARRTLSVTLDMTIA